MWPRNVLPTPFRHSRNQPSVSRTKKMTSLFNTIRASIYGMYRLCLYVDLSLNDLQALLYSLQSSVWQWRDIFNQCWLLLTSVGISIMSFENFFNIGGLARSSFCSLCHLCVLSEHVYYYRPVSRSSFLQTTIV